MNMTEYGFAGEWRKFQWHFVHVYFGDKQVRSRAGSLVSQPSLACLFHGYTLTQRFTNSSDIWGPSPNSRPKM